MTLVAYRRGMSDIVICEPVRTPVGRQGGALASLSAVDLAAHTLRELVRRTSLGEGDVDDVVLGNCYPSGENPAIGRIAALDAGLGTGVPGLQLDRRCGSGLQAVLYAASQVASGAGERDHRRRRRVDVQRRALRPRPAHRRPQRRDRAHGSPGPRPRDCWRQGPPRAGRHAGDGREPAPRVRHLPRGPGRARGPLPAAGRRRPRLPGGSPTSWCLSPSPDAAVSRTWSSTATSTRDPGPPSSSLPGCGPCA